MNSKNPKQNVLDQYLKNIVPLIPHMSLKWRKYNIKMAYELNKALGHKNALLNTLFCKKCYLLASYRLDLNTSAARYTCCNRLFTLNYKYDELLKYIETIKTNE